MGTALPQGRPDLGVAGEGGDAAGVPDHSQDGLEEGAQPAAGGAVSVGAAAPSVSGRRRRQCQSDAALRHVWHAANLDRLGSITRAFT